jgi:hypothetical protein
MVLGLDVRLLLVGLCLGVSSIYLNTAPLPSLSFLRSGLASPATAWSRAFHKVQHAVPIFPDHDHDLASQQPPPIQAMSPVQQRQVKRAEEVQRSRSERRAPAPVCVPGSSR